MKYKIVFPLALAASFLLAAISSKADTFSNNVAASIPDDYPNSGQQLVVTFNVSNLQTSVQSVSLTISMYHQWVGDLDVQLTSPTGTNCIVFSRVGPDIYANGWGNPDTLGTTNASGFYDFLTYTFADSATYTLRGWSSKTYGTNSSNNPCG